MFDSVVFCRSKLVSVLIVLVSLTIFSCDAGTQQPKEKATDKIKTGADQVNAYLSKLEGKTIAVVANQTSVVSNGTEGGYTHLVDSLLSLNIDIKTVFAPEHGFRGQADAGEHIVDSRDPKTNLPIISLYGSNRKPSQEQLSGIDLIVYDIQDVGVRFYTYVSTLHYVMEASVEVGIPVLILDRPNPNGHFVDGPIMEKEFTSFVGMHKVPIAYGMTIGEYGKMINGEGWLDKEIKCDLTVIPLQNYIHNSTYSLPIKPSPNLPNDKAINLYPSVCLFEGTNVSCGRGTEMQFQIFGSPLLPVDNYDFSFTPQPNFGSKHPKHEGKICYGKDLSRVGHLTELNFTWLIDAYNSTADKETFFNAFFTKLAGTKTLRLQIESGLDFEAIKASWEPGLEAFKLVRNKYLIYK